MFKVSTLAFAALITGLLCCAPVARAQVAIGVNIDRLPCALTDTSTMPHMIVLLTAIMGPIGLFKGCFLELAPGFTALTAFSAMSTTGLILITVTRGRCRSAGRSASTTSRQTRRGMGEAT